MSGQPERDDRPAVYETHSDLRDQRMVVYRASSVGRCERALFYARQGKTPAPFSTTIQAAMDESADMEDLVIAELQDKFHVQVTLRQHVVWVPVGVNSFGEEIWVRGSIDGLGEVPSAEKDNETYRGLVEVKVLGDAYWTQYLRYGLAGFPEYEVQFQSYIEGLRKDGLDLEGGWFVVGKKEDGQLVDLRFDWIDRQYMTVVRAKRKIGRVEELHRAWKAWEEFEYPECPQTFGCPYWPLHDDDTGTPVVDRLAASWLTQMGDLDVEIAKLKKKQQDLKDKVFQQVGMRDGEPGTMLVGDGVTDRAWRVTAYEQSRTTWDKNKLEQLLGADADDYRTTKVSINRRITPKEKD